MKTERNNKGENMKNYEGMKISKGEKELEKEKEKKGMKGRKRRKTEEGIRVYHLIIKWDIR